MKTILITGASSEIGIAITNKFYGGDYQLILQGNNNIKKLDLFKPKARIIACNYLDSANFSEFLQQLNNVDILIHAAAITKTQLVTMLSQTEVDDMLTANISCFIKIVQKILPDMIKKRSGIIIGISSIAASRTNRGQAVYGGTKAFMETFLRAVVCEWGSKGIRANCIAPGAIEAGSFIDLMNQAADEIKENIASRKTGNTGDVANLAEFLAIGESGYINGQTIKADGGFLKGL